MALYAIGDLHLGLSVDKPMDGFGPGWENHVQRLQEAFSKLHDDDVTVLVLQIKAPRRSFPEEEAS